MDIFSRLDGSNTLGLGCHLLRVLNDTSGTRRVVSNLLDATRMGVVRDATGVLLSR